MTLRDLYQASWEAEVTLRMDLSQHVQRFISAHNAVTMAVEKRYLMSEGLQASQEEFKDMLTTIYGPPMPDDQLSKRLREAQTHLDEALKRHI